jgi:hypothetical protein
MPAATTRHVIDAKQPPVPEGLRTAMMDFPSARSAFASAVRGSGFVIPSWMETQRARHHVATSAIHQA